MSPRMDDESFNRACDTTWERLKEKVGADNADALVKSIGEAARARGVQISRDEMESIVSAPDAHERLATVGRAAIASQDTPEADAAWARMRQKEREEFAAYKGRGRR
jgi:hypothetical protein